MSIEGEITQEGKKEIELIGRLIESSAGAQEILAYVAVIQEARGMLESGHITHEEHDAVLHSVGWIRARWMAVPGEGQPLSDDEPVIERVETNLLGDGSVALRSGDSISGIQVDPLGPRIAGDRGLSNLCTVVRAAWGQNRNFRAGNVLFAKD